jgi:Ser/Thr protein kinase RdoA (MazF antagonist)
LAGYESFCEFEPRELYLIEALRTLRLIHYSAWLARRWDDPAFPWPSPGSTPNVTGRTASWNCASRSR